MTDKGSEIRETAEQQTDVYFYAPWKALQPTEVQDLHRLMLKLNNELQQNQ